MTGGTGLYLRWFVAYIKFMCFFFLFIIITLKNAILLNFHYCCIRFIYGKPDVPQASPEITLEVHSELAEFQRDGHWDAAVQLVVKAGDPGVESLAANDWYRLRRRLEILKVG